MTVLGEKIELDLELERPVSSNVTIANDIRRAFSTPPQTMSQSYLHSMLSAAQFVRKQVPQDVIDAAESEFNKVPQSDNVFSPFTQALVSETNIVMMARNNVLSVSDEINSFIARAKNADFAPPKNPLIEIAMANIPGTSDITETIANRLVPDVIKYLDLLDAERSGRLDIERYRSSNNLASINMSFGGFGGSGNSLVDLMSFVPDMELVRKEKTRELLSVFDFSKRIPKVLFTADYSPDGKRKGTIICWKKLADASGYIVKRRSVFSNTETSYSISNADLQGRHDIVKEYVQNRLLTFYKGLTIDSVFAYLDDSIAADEYFLYKIQAYQTVSDSKNIFSVESRVTNISVANAEMVRSAQAGLKGRVSPYPMMAERLLGDASLDWALAGLNIRSSINRNDTRETTKNYSYLRADVDYLLQRMAEGKFVVPTDKNSIYEKINTAIADFGVSQTILDILQETGILDYFDGVGPKENTNIVSAENIVEKSGVLSSIVAAIDPETATLDIGILTANVKKTLSSSLINNSAGEVVPEEIQVPPNVDHTDDVNTSDELRFANPNDRLNKNVVDLTTFSGISVLMRAIREITDSYLVKVELPEIKVVEEVKEANNVILKTIQQFIEQVPEAAPAAPALQELGTVASAPPRPPPPPPPASITNKPKPKQRPGAKAGIGDDGDDLE